MKKYLFTLAAALLSVAGFSQNRHCLVTCSDWSYTFPNFACTVKDADKKGNFPSSIEEGDTLYVDFGTDELQRFVVSGSYTSVDGYKCDISGNVVDNLGAPTDGIWGFVCSAGQRLVDIEAAPMGLGQSLRKWFARRNLASGHTDFSRGGEAFYGNTVINRDTLGFFQSSIRWDKGADNTGGVFDVPGNLLLKAGNDDLPETSFLQFSGSERSIVLETVDGLEKGAKIKLVGGDLNWKWEDSSLAESASLGVDVSGNWNFTDNRSESLRHGIIYQNVDTAKVRANPKSLVSSEVSQRIANHEMAIRSPVFVLASPFTPADASVWQTAFVTTTLKTGTYLYQFSGQYATGFDNQGVGFRIKVQTASGSIVGKIEIAETPGRFFIEPYNSTESGLDTQIYENSPGIAGAPVLSSGIINITAAGTIRVEFARCCATGTLTTGVLQLTKVE